MAPSTEIDHALAAHRGWRRRGDALVREVVLRDFDEALALVERVATAAQDHFRRPDMCISGFNRVRFEIVNPDRAGLTLAEVRLAARVSAVVDGRLG